MPAYTNGILAQLPGLNWLLLVEVITVVIASLFWFFYLNRFIGLLLSWAIRLYTWRYLNARIEIRAINIAPLAGRIAFKDVRYYSRNQSLRVLKGHVTWRYWLWRVRDDEIGAKVRNNQSRPCRFAIELEGVEWFLYNRTDSYDKVLEAIGLRYDEETGKVEKAEESIRMDAVGRRPASTDNSGIDWVREILPVEIHAHTGAIILGNRSTPMLLITGFDEVKGAFSVVEARSKFDLYKQVYEFTFSRVRSVFRTNPDYTCSMRDHGRQVVQSLREEHGSLAAADFARTRSPADYLPFPRFLRLLQSLGLDRYVAEYEAKVRGKWEGLARYRPSIDYSITLNAGSSTEYAKVPTLLQAPRIKLEYYCDTAGAVPPLDQHVKNLEGLEGIDIGNGDLTPEWGVDVSIEAGRINYGPWTERQRADLFALFLPATYNDEPATVRKQPGDLREHVALKIFIQFDDKTVIHLPTREQSKDWQYDGKSAPGDHRHQDDRPYGWLDLEAGADSCLSFTIPFVTATQAYESVFELHLDEFNITSSVIAGRLLAAESCRVHCSMPAPLKWDAPREWQFNIGLSKPQLFFLSDHGHLIADLVSDFTSAPPGELLFFQPTTYTFDITFTDYSVVLHLNERNIIRDANSTDSNTLVWLKGPRLTGRVTAPSDQFEPVTTTVGFNVAAEHVAFSITVPQWDTHDSFVSEADRRFCTVDAFKIDGSYLFYSHVQPDNVERLVLNVDARNTVLTPMIWVVKPLVLFVANYIGTMTHFHTLEEVNALKDEGPAALAAGLLDPLDSKHRVGTKDFYEVKLNPAFHDTLIVVPGEHYECRTGLLVYVPDVAFDFRNHDLFADMTLQVDPIELVPTNDCAAAVAAGTRLAQIPRQDCLSIDGVDFSSHRMFGAAPAFATYLVLLDIAVGRIAGSLTPVGLDRIMAVISTVMFQAGDRDNSLPRIFETPSVPDATFITARVAALDVQLEIDDRSALSIQLDHGASASVDTLASDQYLLHVDNSIPDVRIQLLAARGDKRHRWTEVAGVSLDARVQVGGSASTFEDEKQRQLDYIIAHDRQTGRCAFLYGAAGEPSPHHGQLILPSLARSVIELDDAESFVSESQCESRSTDGSLRPAAPSPIGEESSTDEDEDTLRLDRHDAHKSSYWSQLRQMTRTDSLRAVDHDHPIFKPHGWSARANVPTHRDTSLLSSHFSDFNPRDASRSHNIVVSCEQAVDVRLAPAAIDIARRLVESLPVNHGIERALDDLQVAWVADWLRQVVLQKEPETTSTGVAFDAPLVSISLFQDALTGDLASALQSGHQSDVVSEVSLSLTRPHLLFLQDPIAVGGQLKIDEAVLDISPARSDASKAEEVELQLRIAGLEIDGDQQHATSGDVRLHASTGETKLTFIKTASELVLGSVLPWIRSTDALIRVVERKRAFSDAQQRFLVERLAYHCHRIGTWPTDPSFATHSIALNIKLSDQTKNLDDDDDLRQSISWKFIHHLRYGIRQLDVEGRDDLVAGLKKPPTSNPAQQLANITAYARDWRSWDEAEHFDRADQIPLLINLYEAAPAPRVAAFAFLGVVTLELGPISAVALNSKGGKRNTASLSAITSVIAADVGQSYRATGKLSLGKLAVQINPTLFELVQHILTVQRVFLERNSLLLGHLENKAVAAASSGPPIRAGVYLDVVASFEGARLVARAGNAKLALRLVGLTSAIETRLPASTDTSSETDLNLFVGFEELGLEALDAAAKTDVELTRELASFSLGGMNVHGRVEGQGAPEGWLQADQRTEQPIVSVLVATRTVDLTILRRLLSLQEFAAEWIDQMAPQAKPMVEDLRQTMAVVARTPSVYGRQRTASTPSVPERTTPLLDYVRLNVQASFETMALRLQATKVFRFDMTLHETVGSVYVRSEEEMEVRTDASIGSTIVRVLSLEHASMPKTNETIGIPKIRVHVTSDTVTRSSVVVDVAKFTHVFTAPTVQYLIIAYETFSAESKEIAQMVEKLQKTLDRHKKPRRLPPQQPSSGLSQLQIPKTPQRKASIVSMVKPAAEFDLRATLHGFTIGLAAATAVQYFDTNVIEGSVTIDKTGDVRAHAAVTDLALSLAQQNAFRATSAVEFDRSRRLAYFVVDLSVGNRELKEEDLPAELQQTSALATNADKDDLVKIEAKLTKMHAVLQPAAIDALGDFISHYARHLSPQYRKSAAQREASEIEPASAVPAEPSEGLTSTLDRFLFIMHASNIGFAVPLASVDSDLKAPHGVPAFLISVSRVDFGNRKTQNGYARIMNLSAQFVKSFDQAAPSSFDGEWHRSGQHKPTNRISLPLSTLTILPTSAPDGELRWRGHAEVEGLQVDVDPTIVPVGAELADVVTASMLRYNALAAEEDVEILVAAAPKPAAGPAPILVVSPGARERDHHVKLVQIDVNIQSGEIRLSPRTIPQTTQQVTNAVMMGRHGSVRTRPDHKRAESFAGRPTIQSSISQDRSRLVEIFTLPRLTVKVEYQSRHAGAEDHVYVDSVLHSTSNVFTPALIPLLNDAMGEIKTAMRKSAEKDKARRQEAQRTRPQPRSSSRRAGNASELGLDSAAALARPGLATPMHFAAQLRIETSTLVISCDPVVNIDAKLQWKSGSFLVRRHPIDKAWEALVRVEEISLALQHRSSGGQDSMRLAVSNLVTSISMKKLDVTDDKPRVSIVVDLPSLDGSVNLRQVEDYFYFSAIWIDPLSGLGDSIQPVVSSPEPIHPDSPVPPPAPVEATLSAFQVVARVQKINLAVAMGDRLGTSTFMIDTLSARYSDIDKTGKTINIHIGALRSESTGRVTGKFDLDRFEFTTILTDERVDGHTLALKLSSGVFDGLFWMDQARIIMFELDPVFASVADKLENEETVLDATFKVDGVKVVVTPQIMSLVQTMVGELQASVQQARTNQQRKMSVAQHGRRQILRKTSAGGIQSVAATTLSRQIARLDIDLGALAIGAFETAFEAADGGDRTRERVVRVDLGGIQAQLTRDHDADSTLLPPDRTAEGIHRFIRLQLGIMELHLFTELKFAKADPRDRTIDDWLDVRGQAVRGLLIPMLLSDMDSYQTGPDVRHAFNVQIKGDLLPSLNATFYIGLKNFVNSYTKILAETKKALLPVLTGGSPTHERTHFDLDAVRFTAVRMQVDKVMLEFCRNAAATAFINRVLREDKWPEFVHNFATIPFDGVLIGLRNLYEHELKHQRRPV